MPFEHKSLERIAGPQPVRLGKHQISHWNWLNKVDNWLAYHFLERPLNISSNLDVTESTYKSPIETQWEENNVVRVRHYRASGKFAVIVLPPRSAVRSKSPGYKVEQVIASHLATNGISAYEIETPLHGTRRPKGKTIDELIPDLDTLKLVFHQAITETRGLIDLVEEEKVGICGVSLGAIYASIVYGVDERLLSACLIAGGGNLAYIFFESEDKFARYIKAQLERSGISRGKLKEELEEIEPCNYTAPNKSSNLLMINGRNDKGLPLKCALDLAKEWGNPNQYLIGGGHISMLLYATTLPPVILEHFRNRLS